MPGQSDNSGKDTTSGADDVTISPDLESSVQDKLDETFGGVDQDDLDESPTNSRDAADGGDRTTVVREHRRRVRSRHRSPEGGDDDGGFEESPRDPIHDEGTQQTGKPSLRQQGDGEGEAAGEADPTDDDVVHGGDPTPAGEIPPYLIDAARRRGWTDDRIQRFVQADGELARETFEQLHNDANELSRRFAEIGRAMQGQHAQQNLGGQPAPHIQGQLPGPGQFNPPAPGSFIQPPQWQQGQQFLGQFQQQAPQQQQGALLPEFAFPAEVLEGLDDGFKKGILDRVQTHMNQVNQVINQVVGSHQHFIQQNQKEMLYQQVDSFFGGLKGYEKLYGSGKQRAELSHEELGQRMRVLQEADAIFAGAQFQGRPLTIHEALEMAHNLVSSPHQRETARREIQGQLRKREGQATMRPTHRGKPGGDPKNPIEKATQTAARKLRALNGGSSR